MARHCPANPDNRRPSSRLECACGSPARRFCCKSATQSSRPTLGTVPLRKSCRLRSPRRVCKPSAEGMTGCALVGLCRTSLCSRTRGSSRPSPDRASCCRCPSRPSTLDTRRSLGIGAIGCGNHRRTARCTRSIWTKTTMCSTRLCRMVGFLWRHHQDICMRDCWPF